ncbi:TSUP family transporter [Azospirillum sp. SYSU D00513]|uniref:TSUP family transporter n=1 Tax=Azospirillum sp. SYSU D00513 TaxID=2812561 RepID=UPI001A978E29|nr:TSUP family transporter [Azospirillum sp. SYSU D00513]
MESLPFETLGLLFGVALLAGFVDSIAGGGGLLSLPALLSVGLTPVQAVATNKLQSSFGSFSAALRFVRNGEADPRRMLVMIGFTALGSAGGAILVQILDTEFLRDVIPVLLIGIALYLLLSPKAGDVDARQRLSEGAFALICGTTIGFYDGFFGPGTGTFFTIAFVTALGFNLRKATAHTKILNFTSNIVGLLFLLAGGHILWVAGLLMGVGQFLGAQIGAQLVINNGARLVRPMLVAASLAVTARLVWTDPDNILRGAASALLHWFL